MIEASDAPPGEGTAAEADENPPVFGYGSLSREVDHHRAEGDQPAEGLSGSGSQHVGADRGQSVRGQVGRRENDRTGRRRLNTDRGNHSPAIPQSSRSSARRWRDASSGRQCWPPVRCFALRCATADRIRPCPAEESNGRAGAPAQKAGLKNTESHDQTPRSRTPHKRLLASPAPVALFVGIGITPAITDREAAVRRRRILPLSRYGTRRSRRPPLNLPRSMPLWRGDP